MIWALLSELKASYTSSLRPHTLVALILLRRFYDLGASIKAIFRLCHLLLRLCYLLLRLYQGSIKGLSMLYEGSMKAL